jgi:hypothetical protein
MLSRNTSAFVAFEAWAACFRMDDPPSSPVHQCPDLALRTRGAVTPASLPDTVSHQLGLGNWVPVFGGRCVAAQKCDLRLGTFPFVLADENTLAFLVDVVDSKTTTIEPVRSLGRGAYNLPAGSILTGFHSDKFFQLNQPRSL